MRQEWSLRDEILAISHCWPLILLYLLGGGLIGWIAALIWPSPYQASKELYVGINVYKWAEDRNVAAYASGIQFNFPDDYKNWTMSNLNVLVVMDNVVTETLAQLQKEDSAWEGMSKEQLRAMLHVYWRNAGSWRLAATHSDPRRAAQAASAWERVATAQLQDAIENSRQTIIQDVQLQTIAAGQVHITSQIAAAEALISSIQGWLDGAQNNLGDEPLEVEERDQLQAMVTPLPGGVDPANLMNGFPAESAPRHAYIQWCKKAINQMEQIRSQYQAQFDALEAQRLRAAEKYQAAAQKSYGLSANLSVESASDSPPQVEAVRPMGLMILVGAGLGLLSWALIWIGRVTMQQGAQ